MRQFLGVGVREDHIFGVVVADLESHLLRFDAGPATKIIAHVTISCSVGLDPETCCYVSSVVRSVAVLVSEAVCNAKPTFPAGAEVCPSLVSELCLASGEVWPLYRCISTLSII